MANVSITNLPAALPLDGTELVPVVQNGVTVRTTTSAVAGSPAQQQTFLTLNQEPTLPNSRALSASTGLTLTDGGALSALTVGMNGAAASLNAAGNGFPVKTGLGTVTPRNIAVSGSGIAISNGDGQSGNPTVSLTGLPLALANASGAGIVALSGSGTLSPRIITGTTDQIAVANGDGASADPVVSLASNPIVPGNASLTVPVGTTAERPVGQDGMIRYNTDTSTYETYSGGSWNAVATGGISSVSVATANGLAGTVANPTTTPVITMSTTVNGMVKGDGTALSAATAATDYVAPSAYASANGLTMDTARLLGRTTASTGAAEEISVAGGLTLSGGVLTGGIGSVTSVGGTGTVNGITLTGTVTTTGDLTLGGTLSGVSLATQVTGTLPVANGGTGATDATAARSNLSAAASGANTDITSVALTTGTISTSPSASTDIANKIYVDSTAQGLNFHAACNNATTANLTATYNNGTSGVGATLTNSGALAALTVDGTLQTVGKRILVKNQSTASENGAYTVTTVGSGAIAWVLTRATDFDTAGSGANQIDAGDFFYIINGSTNANSSWVQQTPLPITVGTTSIVFIQFGAASGGVSSFSAGTTGLTPNTATTGNITLAGTLAVANGGTGAITAPNALTNLAAAGTGISNTFTANQIVEVTDNTNAALRITQLGTGNALLVEDSTNPDSSPFSVDTNGRLLVGHTASLIGSGSLTAQIQQQGTTNNTTGVALFNWATSATGTTQLQFNKSKSGTIGTNGAVSSGDYLGSINFSGDDGTAFTRAAEIRVDVDGTPGTNDMPGRLVFSTTADGASSPTERMRIDSAGNVGIGGAATAGQSIAVRKNITGATTSWAIASYPSIQSDVTSIAGIFYSQPATQATTFSLTNLYHFNATQGTFGLGSTVTNQYGFFVNSANTGATNNYGFYGNIASGTNRWNLYMNGTADNYFAGDVLQGHTSTLSFSAPAGTVTPTIQSIAPTSSLTQGVASVTNVTSANGPNFIFGKSRGASASSPTIVSSGDLSGNISFTAYDGAAYLPTAYIQSAVDGTPGLNDMPGRLTFSTTADGAIAPTERMRIANTGAIGLSGANYGTAGQVLTSAGSGASPTWSGISGGTF
jgi:hypothetical protein